jgi:hypothetical protein
MKICESPNFQKSANNYCQSNCSLSMYLNSTEGCSHYCLEGEKYDKNHRTCRKLIECPYIF